MLQYFAKTKSDLKQIASIISNMEMMGSEVLYIRIGKKKKTRSLNQSSLYWKWIDLIADQVGDNKDSVHHDMRSLFLPFSRSSITQKLVPATTTKLSVKEMAEYMEKIQAWARQYLNMTLPTADDLIDYSSYER